MINIYSKEKISKLINKQYTTVEDFYKRHPNSEYIATEKTYLYPTWNGLKLLEMTDEEAKLNKLKILSEGEKIENEELIRVKSPSEFHSWNFETLEWFFDKNKKIQKITEINQKAYQEITAIYPEWKQHNIARSKDASQESLNAFNEMTIFIDSIRANSDEEIRLIINKEAH